MKKEEKSVRESPNGIIYRVTPHLSQSARAQSDECRKNRAVDIPNGNSGVSECRARRTCNTCTLGQVRSDPVYYTVRRLPNTLFFPPSLPPPRPPRHIRSNSNITRVKRINNSN